MIFQAIEPSRSSRSGPAQPKLCAHQIPFQIRRSHIVDIVILILPLHRKGKKSLVEHSDEGEQGTVTRRGGDVLKTLIPSPVPPREKVENIWNIFSGII